MPYLERADCALYYEVIGAGPALVFAHGLGGNHLSWWQQVPHFRDRYTCVTFAHRGFAPSAEQPGGPGPRAFADDLAALLAHLDLPDVRLVAQSMGGWTCLDYALRAPGRVRALVLADTTGTVALPDPLARDHAQASRASQEALFARGIHPGAGERMAAEQPALYFLYQEIYALTDAIDKLALYEQLAAMRTTPPGALAALAMPVLCITGEEDIVIPPAAVAALAALIPGARLARVPRAGHSVYFERAATFNGLVDEFLRATAG